MTFINDLYVYTEIYNESSLNKEIGNISTLDIAFQYEVSPLVRLDVGTFIGISPDADDLQSFVGGSSLLN